MSDKSKTTPLPSIWDGIDTLPEDKLDLQSWESAESDLFTEVIAMTSPKTIIEVGSWKGLSAMKMAAITKNRGQPAKIYCVDTWCGAPEHYLDVLNGTNDYNFPTKNGFPQIYQQFLVNVKSMGHHDVITPIVQTSHGGSHVLRKLGVMSELIYIDGDHSYEGCYADLNDYWGLLLPLGIMFGDDFRTFRGVFHAVMRFSHEQNLTLGENDGFWILRKP